MNKFLYVAMLSLAGLQAQAITIQQVQNLSQQAATITDQGPAQGEIWVNKYGIQLTPAEEADLMVSRIRREFPWSIPIRAGAVGGPFVLFGPSAITTSVRTYNLPNVNINTLVIRVDGRAVADGVVLP